MADEQTGTATAEVTTPGDDATAKAPNPNKGNRYSVFDDGKDILPVRILGEDDPNHPGAMVHIEGAPRASNMRDIEKWLEKQEGLDGSQVAIIQIKLLGAVEEVKSVAVTFKKKPRVRLGDAEAER